MQIHVNARLKFPHEKAANYIARFLLGLLSMMCKLEFTTYMYIVKHIILHKRL